MARASAATPNVQRSGHVWQVDLRSCESGARKIMFRVLPGRQRSMKLREAWRRPSPAQRGRGIGDVAHRGRGRGVSGEGG